MFRILLQTKAASLNSPATYQYLMDKNTVWETNDSTEALERFEAELDNYKKSVMTLVRIVDVDLNPTALVCDLDKDGDGVHDSVQGGVNVPPLPEVTEEL